MGNELLQCYDILLTSRQQKYNYLIEINEVYAGK